MRPKTAKKRVLPIFYMLAITSVVIFFVKKKEDKAVYFKRKSPKAAIKVSMTQHAGENRCPVIWEKTIKPNIKPLLSLHRGKFLLPVLINGPNNQLVGFRKSIFIAIKLNRTIAIPRFFKHKTGEEINAWHRVDQNQLSQLLPTINIDEYRKKCSNTADSIFRTRIMSKRAYQRIERETNITLISKITRQLNENVAEYPITFPRSNSDAIQLRSQDVTSAYDSNGNCAVHPFQFTSLRIREIMPNENKPNAQELPSLSDTKLFSEIIRYTGFPNHIKFMASEFLQRFLNNHKYLSVHWRFNKEDWMKSCTNENAPKVRMEMCDNVQHLKPSHIADGIATKMKGVEVNDVYVASPPSQKELLHQVKQHLILKHNIKMYYTCDLMELWNERYESCDWLWSDVNDLLSSTEMEICSRALVFLRSPASTWSNNVALSRYHPGSHVSLDEGIYELVMEAKAESEKQTDSE